MSADTVAMTLRLPRELHGRLVALAALDRRSLSGEVIAALSDYATRNEAWHAMTPREQVAWHARGGRWRPAWPRAAGIGGQPNGTDPD